LVNEISLLMLLDLVRDVRKLVFLVTMPASKFSLASKREREKIIPTQIQIVSSSAAV